MPKDLLISFVGDDFTGSTDAMESLALAGVRTVLFAAPPTDALLAQYADLRAFGIATTARSQLPNEMEHALRPIFHRLREIGPPIVHYKVCSTFDSSPAVGSIGRAIDIGAEVFGSRCVPVVVGAPALGRYTAFGHLFARGGDGQVHRIDRHPTMSRHPVTPMDEADLRRHLAMQTGKSIGLVDMTKLDQPREKYLEAVASAAADSEILFLDVSSSSHLSRVGEALDGLSGSPRFVVGSSGVEAALCAHWNDVRAIVAPPGFAPPSDAGPILVACGSCSPVTERQITTATTDGFVEVQLSDNAVRRALDRLADGCSVIIHTQRAPDASEIGRRLGAAVRDILERRPVRRMIVAGGDTSGAIAAALGVESIEMIAPLVRGAPLCRVSAPNSPADGMEVVFKGGQIGPESFFVDVASGTGSN